MRIPTWTVNSVKARLPRLVSWLADRQPDMLLAQEIKATEAPETTQGLLRERGRP